MTSGARKRNGKDWVRLLALFFLLYALSDGTVLQAYNGNEALGIPPDHHMFDSGHHASQTSEPPCTTGQTDCEQTPDHPDYDHQHQSFCWQQVGVAYYSFELDSAVKLANAQPTNFYEELHSNSAISYLFRPPRTA